MDAGGFVEWAWSLTDENKAALAERVARVRIGTDEHFLREARSSAEAAITTTGFDAHEANVAAAPDDALDEDGRDLKTWNRAIGDDLRAAYEDAMLALGAGTGIGRGHRRVLAEPLLPEVPGLEASLGLA